MTKKKQQRRARDDPLLRIPKLFDTNNRSGSNIKLAIGPLVTDYYRVLPNYSLNKNK